MNKSPSYSVDATLVAQIIKQSSARHSLYILTALIAVVALAPAAFMLKDIPLYLQHSIPPGQLLYVLSKYCGLCAFFLLALQVLLGLYQPRPWFKRVHPILGASLLVLFIAHAGLFTAAASLRSGHLAWGVLTPSFTTGYYNFGLSLGLVGLVLLLLVAFAGFKRWQGKRQWRWLHRCYLPAFILVSAHSLMIGTETGWGMVEFFYALVSLMIGWALIAKSIKKHFRYAKQN